MQDRFKFRVWNETKKYWEERAHISILYSQTELRIYKDLKNGWAQDAKQAGYKLDLEQCTGLKDKNGKLIYEGDIIELTRARNYGWCKKGRRLKVQWNTFNCCGFGFGAIGNLTTKCAENCIVIGNIHENPELLEKQENE